MKVLIVKISSMGDIIHTLPALTDATNNISNVCFDWVIEEDFSEIPIWHPSVHQIFTVNIRKLFKNCFTIKNYKNFLNFRKQLKKNNYNTIIDAQGLIKSSLLMTNIASGKKHGLDYNSAREPISSWFYDYTYSIKKQQHAIERIRQLFSAILNYPISSKIGNYNIKNYFNKFLFKKNPYLIFIHSSTVYYKQWPENNWRTIIKLVNNVLKYRIKLLWKTPSEYYRAKRLAYKFDHVEILPKMNLTNIAEQFVNAKALISIDTGLSHLAAALNCINLTLYGPTNPTLIGTYGFNQYKICSKIGNMKTISAEYVWDKFKKILFKNKIVFLSNKYNI